VYAVADGSIGRQFGPLNSRDPQLLGLRLHLNTADNEYYYAHLSEFAPGIGPGVNVHRGDLLGNSGDAGGVPHLHFGVRHGDPTVILRNAREHADTDAVQNYTPPEVNQSIQPLELNQSIQPSELNQSIAPPEVNQSIQQPELNQSPAPSHTGYETGSSDMNSSDAGSYNAGSYDSGSSDVGGYGDSGLDGGGYDGGGSDAGSVDAGGYDGSSDAGLGC